MNNTRCYWCKRKTELTESTEGDFRLCPLCDEMNNLSLIIFNGYDYNDKDSRREFQATRRRLAEVIAELRNLGGEVQL
jgi:hypothetical protein